MNRGRSSGWATALICMLSVLVIAVVGTAQPDFGEFVRFEVSDLQLISWESRPDWDPAWTGPIEAATIMAWFHDHGYPGLLLDLNGDGIVDELDTIELADRFGRNPMKTEQRGFTSDAWLVHGLASYVAERYTDEFVLKLYDSGFPMEFAREIGMEFAPDVIPGIEMVLEPEPNYASYRLELESAEGVILGIAQSDEVNEFFAGRSFLLDPIDEQTYGIDMVWAKEDFWTPGAQGQVLATQARQTDALYVMIDGAWRLVEFMLALSPRIEPGTGTPHQEHYPCPPDAVAYDVTTTNTPFGRVEIEECVTREGDIDTYTYTVRNIDFEINGCGICWFGIPNFLGLPTISQTGPVCWFVNPYTFPVGWDWHAPMGDCGILPGGSRVFSFSVPGPTTDTYLSGGVSGCPVTVQQVNHTEDAAIAIAGGGIRELRMAVRVRTTGPGEGPGRCPDLVAEVLRVACDPMLDQYAVVITGRIANIGTAPAGPSEAAVAATYGGVTEPIPALAQGDDHVFTTTVYIPAGVGPVCPLAVNIHADSGGVVAECNEDNNVGLGEVCCEDVPTQEEGCPDPYFRRLSGCYTQTGVTGAVGYVAQVTMSVRNQGDVTAEDLDVEVSVGGSLRTVHFGDLAPGVTSTKTISVSTGTTFPGAVSATIDPDNDIDESCYPEPDGEFNNFASTSIGRNNYCGPVN